MVSVAQNDLAPDTVDETLLSEIMHSISTQKKRDGMVVADFLGFHNDEPMSLAAIAREHNISRERARQVFNRAKKNIQASSSWHIRLQEKLDYLLRKRQKPLRLYMLELEDDWFEGASHKPQFMRTLLNKFLKSDLNVIQLSDVWTISRVSKEGFQKTLKSILTQFECAADERYTESETLLLVSAFLHGRGQGYLIDDIYKAIAPFLHFHSEPRSPEKILVGVGSSIGSMVQAALSSFDSPQHYTIVAERYCELIGTDLNESVVKQVHHSLISTRFLLYGRGTYGTWEHFPLPLSKRIQIARESARLLRKVEINRQWHAVEIMNLLLRKSREPVRFLVPCLDKYSLSILLSNSDSFLPLGRMVFKLSGGRVPENRFDISDLAEKVLLDAGHPLPRYKLLGGIKKFRGMNSEVCSLGSSRVGRVAPGVWGLVDRDFFLDKDKQIELLNLLEQHLSQVVRPLNHCDIGRLLDQSDIDLPEEFSTYMLVGLAETDERFRIYRTSVALAD